MILPNDGCASVAPVFRGQAFLGDPCEVFRGDDWTSFLGEYLAACRKAEDPQGRRLHAISFLGHTVFATSAGDGDGSYPILSGETVAGVAIVNSGIVALVPVGLLVRGSEVDAGLLCAACARVGVIIGLDGEVECPEPGSIQVRHVRLLGIPDGGDD